MIKYIHGQTHRVSDPYDCITRFAPASAEEEKMSKRININPYKHMISNVCADAAALLVSKADVS